MLHNIFKLNTCFGCENPLFKFENRTHIYLSNLTGQSILHRCNRWSDRTDFVIDCVVFIVQFCGDIICIWFQFMLNTCNFSFKFFLKWFDGWLQLCLVRDLATANLYKDIPRSAQIICGLWSNLICHSLLIKALKQIIDRNNSHLFAESDWSILKYLLPFLTFYIPNPNSHFSIGNFQLVILWWFPFV